MSDDLLDAARAVQRRAYAPHSGFRVRAAVRRASSAIYAGRNVEGVSDPERSDPERSDPERSDPERSWAETSAIAATAAAGEVETAKVAVIATAPGPVPPSGVLLPCIAEFAGHDVRVTMATPDGQTLTTTMAKPLPSAVDASLMQA
ncbi:MAG: cytidine deaminase [Pseudomonadota bacterium]